MNAHVLTVVLNLYRHIARLHQRRGINDITTALCKLPADDPDVAELNRLADAVEQLRRAGVPDTVIDAAIDQARVTVGMHKTLGRVRIGDQWLTGTLWSWPGDDGAGPVDVVSRVRPGRVIVRVRRAMHA